MRFVEHRVSLNAITAFKKELEKTVTTIILRLLYHCHQCTAS